MRAEQRPRTAPGRGGRLAAMALVVAFSLAGCAFLTGGPSWDPFASQAERRLAIRVENAARDDMRVRAIGGGRRHDLGTINGRSFRQTSIPWSSTRDLRFEIDPVMGRRHTTRGVLVAPGERVELIIVNPVQRSIIRR